MSRTLSKILVACAMIVIFPLMIVGTAFAAYYSIEAKVNVFVYTNTTSSAKDAFAQVTYDGRAYNAGDTIKIQNGHLNNLALTAKAEGYDFKGWFVGDLESYTNAHRAGKVKFDAGVAEEIKFNMTDYQNLVAVFEIKTIIVISYYDGETLLTSEEVYENKTHSLLDAKELVTAEKGYRYLWKDADGFEITTINTNKNVDLYLNREIITYAANVSVNNNEVSYVGNEDLKFYVNDSSNLEAIFNKDNYKAKYSFWAVSTITVNYNGETYTDAAGLANAIIESKPHEATTAEISVEATVTKNFETITITNGITFTAGEGITSDKKVYDSTNGNLVYELPEIDQKDTTSSIYSLLGMQQDGNVITLYSDVNGDGTREAVALKYLTVKIGGDTYSFEIDGSSSINDLIELLYQKTKLTDGETLTIDSMIARFVEA